MEECKNCRNDMFVCDKCGKTLCSKDCYREDNDEEQHRYINGKKVCKNCMEDMEKPDDVSLLESIHKKDKRSIKEWMDDAKAGKQMRIC